MKRRVAEDKEAKSYCKKCLNYISEDQQVAEREMCENMLKGDEE
ncbi:MAG: hypothetical protein QM765_19475 [Myxococcales bacterium]